MFRSGRLTSRERTSLFKVPAKVTKRGQRLRNIIFTCRYRVSGKGHEHDPVIM